MKSQAIKYGLIGSSGRLGTEVAYLFSEKKHKLVYKVNSTGINEDDIPELIIDCSLPSAFQKTVEVVKRLKVPLVIATTGLTHADFDMLTAVSSEIPVVQSYNFSLGVQVILKLTETANSILKNWDVEISETHHRFKKDKPSGTALMIKEKLAPKPVNISSMRLGNVTGDHTVIFGGLGETISITHHAISRRTFAEGILLSSEFILKQKKGLYTFKEVVFGKK